MEAKYFGNNTKDYMTLTLQIGRIYAEENKLDTAI